MGERAFDINQVIFSNEFVFVKANIEDVNIKTPTLSVPMGQKLYTSSAQHGLVWDVILLELEVKAKSCRMCLKFSNTVNSQFIQAIPLINQLLLNICQEIEI